MSKYNADDLYVLRFLNNWNVSRKQMAGLVHDVDLTPDRLVESLKKLEANKLIKITGPQTLVDLEKLVIKAGKFDNAPPEGTEARHAFNNMVFGGTDIDGRANYSYTEVNLTLWGHLRLAIEGAQAPEKKPQGPCNPRDFDAPPPC